MEQGQCWMQTKRKYSLSSNLTSQTNLSYDDSWEEQAFAEDAANSLDGGCIWPPRSYSCSFCKREFRSAQALGGHMNVHRRDRARLKQPSRPKSEILYHHELESHHHLHKPLQNNPFTSLGYLPNSPACGLSYKTNPNSDPDVLASPSFPSLPNKALASQVNGITCREETLIPLYNSSTLHSSSSWSNLDRDHKLYSYKFHPEANIEKASKGLNSWCKGKWDSDDTDEAMNLNLVVCRDHSPVKFETKELADISCKKRKTEASSIPFFPKSSSVDRHQMFECSPSSIEGGRSGVKAW